MSKRPVTIRNMAWRRGLAIHKARRGGWYVTLIGSGILYATHSWPKIEQFIKTYPVLVSRKQA